MSASEIIKMLSVCMLRCWCYAECRMLSTDMFPFNRCAMLTAEQTSVSEHFWATTTGHGLRCELWAAKSTTLTEPDWEIFQMKLFLYHWSELTPGVNADEASISSKERQEDKPFHQADWCQKFTDQKHCFTEGSRINIQAENCIFIDRLIIDWLILQ